jgi:hypothetical protein
MVINLGVKGANQEHPLLDHLIRSVLEGLEATQLMGVVLNLGVMGVNP